MDLIMKKLLLISQILFLPLMAQSTQLKRSVSATTSVQAESEAVSFYFLDTST